MRSKTSCFNKTLFLKNITRFWPIWALYLVVLFFSMPINLYLNLRLAADSVGRDAGLLRMLQCIRVNISPAIVFVFAALCALAVFSYLYSARNCNMMHAFPVRRGELFFTNYVSGLLFLIVPQVLIFLMTLLVCIFNNVTSVEYLFYWLLYVMGMGFFFYSCAVFFCMLTGNHFAAVAYYILGNIVYAAFKMLVTALMEILNYGLTSLWDRSRLDMCLSPLYFLIKRVNISWNTDGYSGVSDIVMYGGRTVAVYVAAAVALIILSVLFYRKRQLECAGDILSVGWLKPVFRWMAAFGIGCGFAMLFTMVFFYDRPEGGTVLKACSVGFSLIFFFAAEMLIRKKFRVFAKKRLTEGIVCAAAVFLVLTAIDADLFGLERYVPDAEDVQCVKLSSDYDIVASEPEKIRLIREIHQSAVAHRKEYERANEGEHSYVSLSYYLKDGREVSREYRIPLSEEELADADSAVGKLAVLQSDPETYLQYLVCKNYEDVRFVGGSFYLSDEQGGSRELTEEQAQKLFDAFRQDLAEGNYIYGVRFFLGAADLMYMNSITLEGNLKGKPQQIYEDLPDADSGDGMNYSWTEDTPDEGESTGYFSFSLYTSCRHMIQALTDLGIIEDESRLILQSDYAEMNS